MKRIPIEAIKQLRQVMDAAQIPPRIVRTEQESKQVRFPIGTGYYTVITADGQHHIKVSDIPPT